MKLKVFFHTFVGLLYFGVLCGAVQRVQAEDWPTFRGADRTGIAPDTGLLDEWPAEGPKLLWAADGAGRGYASPAISGNRLFTLGDGPSTAGDADEYLTCFDLATGKQLWKTKTGEPWNNGRTSWQGSRATPTVDGDRVYVMTPFGKLYCAKTSNGEVLWSKDLKGDLGGKKKDVWGYSESPLIDGSTLVCTPGGPKNTVVGLDKMSGDLVWSCARPDDVGAGHSCVVIANVGGKKIYVQNTGGGPMGIDAATGELLWDYDMSPPTAFIPTPIIQGDYVFSVAGYKLGAALLKQVATSAGGVEVEEIYAPKTELGNKHGGVVEVDGKIYGGYEDQNIVYCADMLSGEVLWKERGSGSRSTSVVVADGKLFVRYQNGVVALAKLDPSGFSEISSFKTPGSGDGDKPSWAHPVIVDGKLYLREGDQVLCYQVAK
ncbi:MAG: PQQ-binding-like beta-propeller repeat protein [Aureliella sp.]